MKLVSRIVSMIQSYSSKLIHHGLFSAYPCIGLRSVGFIKL